jgi:alpha-beta hydrolase superfamily lysophospholipase
VRALARLLGGWLPNLPLGNGLSPDWLSRDPAVVAAYRADPLVHDRIAPRLARFLFTAGGEVQAVAPRWRTPTTLLWSGADRCVAPGGSAMFAAAAPPGVVRGTCFPGLLHEILNEPERDAVFAALAASLPSALDNPASRQPDSHEAMP